MLRWFAETGESLNSSWYSNVEGDERPGLFLAYWLSLSLSTGCSLIKHINVVPRISYLGVDLEDIKESWHCWATRRI